MGTRSCHSNQISNPTEKTYIFVTPTYRCFMCNMERIGLTVSEEMSFENVDERTTDDVRTDAGCLYTISSPMSLQLR